MPNSSTDPKDPSRREVLKTAGQGLLAAAAVPLAPPDKQPPKLTLPEPLAKKVGFAIVGLGQLALEEILPGFKEAKHCRPVALVSGHPDKAKQVAAGYGIDPKQIYDYESFDKIANDDTVDVVYIVLPNNMHAEYTIRALKAGKHVLCEKPMAPSVKECEEMIAAAKQAKRKLMIAYRLHYEPYNRKMIEMSRKKEFGEVRMIEASNVQDTKAPNIRLSKATAGGALTDIGIYCLNACRYITGEEPAEAFAFTTANPKDERFREVEENVSFTLKFPSGVIAHCGSSFSCGASRRYRVFCTEGWMELDPAFDYRGLRLRTGRSKEKNDERHFEEVHVREVDQFAAEMDHFSECVMNDTEPATPGEEGLADMRIIEKIYESARIGQAVKL